MPLRIPLKVCFATYDSQNDVSGVSSWLQRLLPQLRINGFEAEVHVVGNRGVNCERFAQLGIPFKQRPWEPDMREAVRNCLEMVQESQPDFYVPNCIVPAYFAAGYARRQGVHTIGVLHSDDPFYWGVVDEFINGSRAFQLSAVVSVSKFLDDSVRAAVTTRKIVSRRIGCGVPPASDFAQKPDGAFRLIYTGRLEEEQKCISQVTRSLCAAVKKNPGMEAWIVGEGSARSNVEQIIRASGVEPPRVKLLGRVENSRMYSVLRQSHALVLLSDYEGLPVSVLEAMAVGVVPVCLDTRSGIREAIDPGINGCIVKNREADFLLAVESLQQNPQLWSKLSANARATIVERFSVEACSKAWAELLSSFEKCRRAPFKCPRFISLPGRNPKFGIYDQRTPLLRKTVNDIRIALGRYRRSWRTKHSPG